MGKVLVHPTSLRDNTGLDRHTHDFQVLTLGSTPIRCPLERATRLSEDTRVLKSLQTAWAMIAFTH
jgi:hypothetical protein